MSWGRYIEAEMYEATLEDEAQKIYFKNKGIREQVLRRILGDSSADGFRRRQVKMEDVPFRVRPPMADDPDDPLGLYDKSDPVPAPTGRYKDPRELWDQLNGR